MVTHLSIFRDFSGTYLTRRSRCGRKKKAGKKHKNTECEREEFSRIPPRARFSASHDGLSRTILGVIHQRCAQVEFVICHVRDSRQILMSAVCGWLRFVSYVRLTRSYNEIAIGNVRRPYGVQ